MTKFVEWMGAAGVFLMAWLSLIMDLPKFNLSPNAMSLVIAMPLYLLIAFACSSLAVIGYRVATFNDCDHESELLKKEIAEAKKELTAHGFTFANQDT